MPTVTRDRCRESIRPIHLRRTSMDHARNIRSLLEPVSTTVASVIVCAALVSTRANPALCSLGNSEPKSVAFAQRQGSAQALPTPKRQQIRALVVYSRTVFFMTKIFCSSCSVAPTRLLSFHLSRPNVRTVTYFAVPGTVSFVGLPDFLSFLSAGPDGIKQPSVLPFTQICFKYSELPYR